MDDAYARIYAGLARSHWWWRARDAMVRWELARRLGGRTGLRILDVGCGDGRLFEHLSRYGRVEGIEPDAASRAAGSPHGEIHPVPFIAPLPIHGPYDVILMLDVLEHLSDAQGALGLAHQLLAPGGLMVLTVPALPLLWTHHDVVNRHVLRYGRGALRREMATAGFRVLDMRFLFHALIGPKLLVRLVERIRPPGDQPPTVPPPIINGLLAATFRAEARVMRPISGWLPGSSLLAVLEAP